MAPWYLFNPIIKKAGNTNVVLRHALLEAISKKFGEEKTLK